ncbi:hypothetical protein [uncultured Roseobacter sp.]|uniref:hypothetical protein n=1 Tax=uncultured Roseobacter sp. TaxID=114847 RepID=UPI00262B799C|nr:hypothetical protein [uncultured Roseobacter sp.]
MSDDFELLRSCFQLPYELETFEGRRIIRDTADLKDVYSAVRAHYARNGVSQMYRHCVEARFRDQTTVVATHETRLVSGNVITQAPFAVYSELRFTGEKWVIVSSSYAIGDRDDHNQALLGRDSAVS